MLHPYLVVLWLNLSPERRTASAGQFCNILVDLVMIGAAILLLADWRISRSASSGRMAAALVLVGVQSLPLAVLAISDPMFSGHSFRLTVAHLLTLAAVLALLSRTGPGAAPPRISPVLTGLGLGVAVLAVRLLVLWTDESPLLDIGRTADVVLVVVIGALICGACVLISRSGLPRWAARRVAIAVILLFAARVWATAAEAQTPPPGTIVVMVLGSAMLATTAAALLRASIAETRHRLMTLTQRATSAEAVVKHGREVAHELRATTAGIVAGAHLLASGRIPPGPERAALAHMVDSEVERLERIIGESRTDVLTEVLLDDVLEPLIIAQATLGHRVHWAPSGHHVLGRPDALAEAMNVLLTNAARHGNGSGTTVTTRVVATRTEILVSDSGPGIEPRLRPMLFEWGTRGSHSMGQGIGLQLAHRLMQEQGGSLEVDYSHHDRGTTFIASLPTAPGHFKLSDPPSDEPLPPRGDPGDLRTAASRVPRLEHSLGVVS